MAESLANVQRLSIATSPEEARRRVAMALLNAGMSGAPVQHWTQGIDRVAKALIGGMEMRDIDRADKEALGERGNSLRRMLGGGEPEQYPTQTPASPSVVSGPVSSAPPSSEDPTPRPRGAPSEGSQYGGMQPHGGYEPPPGLPPEDQRAAGMAQLRNGMPIGGAPQEQSPPIQPIPVQTQSFPRPASPSVATGVNGPPPQSGTQRIAQALVQPRPAPGINMPPEVRAEVDRLLATRSRAGIARAEELAKPYFTPSDPSYGVIGKSPEGDEVFGWVDKRTQSVRRQELPPGPVEPNSLPPAPPGVDPKLWRQKQTEALAANAAPGTPEAAGKLRGEVRQLKSYQNLSEAAPIYKSMYETAGRNTRASDLNLVYGLAKMFDPTSVVREGEMIMVRNTASLPDWVVGQINSLNGGATLQPDTRQAVMAEAHTRMQSYEQAFERDSGHYRGIAGRSRVNTDDVLPPFERSKPWQPKPPQWGMGGSVPFVNNQGSAAAPRSKAVEPGDYVFENGRLIRRGR